MYRACWDDMLTPGAGTNAAGFVDCPHRLYERSKRRSRWPYQSAAHDALGPLWPPCRVTFKGHVEGSLT
jgi:hypothetical protein